MTGGAKPTPIALRLVTGNPSRRPIPDEIKSDMEVPRPPDHLTPVAVEEWHRVTDELCALGIINGLDTGSLALYCVTYALWVEAEEALNFHRVLVGDGFALTIKSPTGNITKNPLLTIAREAGLEFLKVASELGMTPVSRTRLAIKARKEKDEFFND